MPFLPFLFLSFPSLSLFSPSPFVSLHLLSSLPFPSFPFSSFPSLPFPSLPFPFLSFPFLGCSGNGECPRKTAPVCACEDGYYGIDCAIKPTELVFGLANKERGTTIPRSGEVRAGHFAYYALDLPKGVQVSIPSLPFPSLPIPSFPFPSLLFPPLPFPSFPFLSLPFLSFFLQVHRPQGSQLAGAFG